MYQAVMNQTGVSIVLGSYNRLKFLKLTIDSLRFEINNCSFPCEIIVVDGGSTDGTVAWLTRQKDVISIIQHNRGEWKGKKIKRRSWGYFMNLGFKVAQGKYVCMVSDDCLMLPGALANGYSQFESLRKSGKNIGAIAFFWRNWPDANYYWIGKLFEMPFVNHGLYLNEAMQKVNYIDEDNYRFYYADGDFSLRIIQAGYQIVAAENSYIEHYNYANLKLRSENANSSFSDLEFFKSRWKHESFYDEKQFDLNIDPEKISISSISIELERNNRLVMLRLGKLHRRNRILNKLKRIIRKVFKIIKNQD